MKYHYYATTARREKMVQICELFEDCSKYELEHAKMWYKLLIGSGTTQENLRCAVAEENAEQNEAYRRFAQEAREEGFEKEAEMFEGVAAIAGRNRQRFAKLLQNLDCGEVFARPEAHDWICSTCGNVLHAQSAPEVCPVCDHGRAYYRIYPENY